MRKIGFLLGGWWLLLAACSSGGPPGLSVRDAYSPEPPPTAENAVFYLEIENDTAVADTLTGAQSDACTVTELHETYDKGDGLMGMRPLPAGLPIPAGETVRLERGGPHVMCIGKMADFTAGSQIPLTLTFTNAGEMTVTAVVR